MTIDERKILISKLLSVQQRTDCDFSTSAEQSFWLWHHIGQQLIPLIGDIAFQALYARAVHFTLPHCPGFTLHKTGMQEEEFFLTLKQDLSAMEHGVVEQCNTVLLNKFTDLVVAMIGEVLMDQILHVAWDAQTAHANVKRTENDN